MAFFKASATAANNNLVRADGDGKIASGFLHALIGSFIGLAGDLTGKIFVGSGTNTVAAYSLSNWVRDNVLNQADAAGVRTAIGAFGAPTITEKTVNYEVAAGDLNKVLVQTASAKTFTLDNAADLGANFFCTLKADQYAVTVATKSDELLDGTNATVTSGTPDTIPAWESRTVFCDGAKFYYV